MNVTELIGTAAGIGFLAGIRLYFTVFALGLLIRFNLLPISDRFEPVGVLATWPVIVTAAVLAIAEFISDKVPWFDSLWDSIHTFVRPLGAAALAFAAAGAIDPGLRTALVLVTGGVALTSHAAKASARVAVNHSPEPFSNVVLSVAEDLVIPVGLWMTFHFPLIVLGIVVVFLVIFFWLIRKVIRFFRERWRFST